MKDDKLKTYLQERMDSVSYPIDDDLWSSVSQTIAKRKRNRRIRAFVTGFSAAAVIILGLLLSPIFKNKDYPQQTDVQKSVAPKHEATQLCGPEDLETVIPENCSRRVKAESKIISEVSYVNNGTITTADSSRQTTINESKPIQNSTSNPKESKKEDVKQINQPVNNDNYSPKTHQRKQKTNRDMSLLLAMNASGISNGHDEQKDMVFEPGEPIIGDHENPICHFPISFGIRVRKNITDRFALESGLMYTYLRTTGDLKEVKVHYLGIPIKAIYTMYDRNKFSVYASAGGMVERQIYGVLKHSKSGNMTFDNSKLQWSVNGAIGVSYKLTNNLGLFAEPGVSYFFDDGSKNIPSIRKEHPLNFNFQVGFRFDIKQH